MNNKFFEGIGLGFIAVIMTGLLLFIAPIIAFVCGWFGGVILHLLTGSYLTNGLNLLFNTHRFHGNNLPMICATLAALGSYLKSSSTKASADKD